MNGNSGRDWFLLLILFLIGGVLGRQQTLARNAGEQDFVTSTVHAAVAPVANGVGGATQSVSGFFAGMFIGDELAAENKALRSLAASAALYQETVERLHRELDRLRKNVDLPPAGGRSKLPADVVGFSARENRLTISIGKNKGLKKGLPVVTADGLVGVVSTVGENQAQVTLLSDPYLTIGALIERNPPPVGLLKGESPGTSILTLFDSEAPAQIGDVVVTSGFSENVPRGIPIGRIVLIDSDKAFGAKRAHVFPFAQLGTLREVFVLR